METRRIIRLVDRTRITVDWKCKRSRFLGYELRGIGVTKATTSLPLFTGIVVHDALAAIATFTRDKQPVPIDEIAEAAFHQVHDSIFGSTSGVSLEDAEEFASEQASLTEGMIRGFYKHVWPRLLTLYPKIVAIEQEVQYQLGPGYMFMAKPDLLMEDLDGNIYYIEYKTTSSKKDTWIHSWETAVQLHSSVKAVEQTLGILPTAVQIIGLYKGYESYGKQSSPFCYAYTKKGNPPFTQDQVSYEYRAGLKRSPTWQMAGGVKAWIEGMPENLLADQFPMTAPIFINESLVKSFFDQTLIREAEIAQAMADISVMAGSEIEPILDQVFPQTFEACAPGWGYGCQFVSICHGGITEPLEQGFKPREPHHKLELEQIAEDL